MAAYKYEFAINGTYKVSPQVFGEMLEDMRNRGVEVTPKAVLDAGRDANSPIHNEFEWNDTAAAEKYRLGQAQAMIRNVRIVVEEMDPKDRGFVPIPGNRSVYVPLQEALKTEEYKNHLLKMARNDAMLFLSKYRRLAELAGVTAAMEEFLRVG